MGLILLIALFSALFIADVIFFSLGKYEYSIAIMLASLVGAYFLSPTIASFVHGSWAVILTQYFPAYLVLGFISAVAKWIQYNFKRASTIRDAKEKFDAKNPVDIQIVDTITANNRERIRQGYLNELERYNRAQKRGRDIPQFGSGEADVTPPSVEPTPPVFEPIPAEEAAANRRKAFVEYYGNQIARGHKTYSVDHTKPTSVVDALTPRAKDNVGLITIWIFQWPIVIVDTLISDFLIKLGKHAARLFDRLFSKIGRKLIGNATKGL